MERIYRDPVHNIIALSTARTDDALLIRLIDTPEFQRLRYIKQLGLALYTFQGAEHSRFTHSLGVMHVMTRVLDHLSKKYRISSEARLVARVAAMLHDIGHGPFSHVIEKILRQHHENWTARIIAEPNTVVHQCLTEVDAALPEKVIAAIEHRFQPAFIGHLVSSQLDVDRLDYLLRDSLMTGVKYGNYDLEWILHALEIDEVNDRIYVAANGLYAVEEYLQARFYMFRQVYFHRTLRSAEGILVSILRRAVELMCAGELQFVVAGSVIERVLRGEELAVSDYLNFDDHDVMFHLKQWMREPDAVLSDLAERFIKRRLFKALDLEMAAEARAEFVAAARNCVTAGGFDPAYYLVEDRAADIPYYGYYRPDGKSRLIVERSTGSRELCDIAEVSTVIRGMRGYEIHRICYPPEVSGAVEQLKR
ncbi:MAG: HD domain-containing protein [Acidobacteria bacterium]|nr:HD domain-containing protein [Acidobacteriota bacterium]MBI3425127.1 HD domain-containing protein [Acidobacteriota bacterium]